MQLDTTCIAVRERTMLDTFDLALHVTRRFAWPLVVTFFAAAIPLMLVNHMLIGWMMEVEYREAYFYMDESVAIARYMWCMLLLVFMEAPLASVFMTMFLGQAIFVERPSYRQIWRDVFKMSPRLIWCQLLVRGVLPMWLLMASVDRYGDFNPGVEIFLAGALAAYAALLRTVRPFLNEVVLLERNPLRSRSRTAMTVNRRCSQLHAPSAGDLFARWLASAGLGMLLGFSVFGSFMFVSGVFLNDWLPGPFAIQVTYPMAMWVTACFLAVSRFLSYLDLRIRHEGWEVELRLRAEATRQATKLV